MATIKEINDKFRLGQYEEAFNNAYQDWQQDPNNVWEQRKMGWAYTYMMKHDAEIKDFSSFKDHLEKLLSLPFLNIQDDASIFEVLLWRIGQMPLNNEQRSMIFSIIKHLKFKSCDSYSALLKNWIKDDEWTDIGSFVEWWDLSAFQPEDYETVKYVREDGKQINLMPLAEQVHIVYAKLLLKENNSDKIRKFIPQLEYLANTYPQMIYPNYYCGKLLLSLDADSQQTLSHLIPFVRRKQREFWAWQLLSEAFEQDKEKQLACLLRAVDCCNTEHYLGKIRLQIALLYVLHQDFSRAKYHVEKAFDTYTKRNWRIPPILDSLFHQSQIKAVSSTQEASIDFKTITNNIIGHSTRKEQGQKKQSETILIKGKITMNKAKTTFFITDNIHFAYIPKSLAKNLREGAQAIAIARKKFNKKRGEMGLFCINIEQFYSGKRNNAFDEVYETVLLDVINSDYYTNEDINFPF